MRVAVAGSSGLIGSALVAALRAAGDDVLRLVRRDPGEPGELRWDPPSGTVPRLDGTDVVVNFCGAPLAGGPWSHARRQILVDSRTTATDVLACAVAEQRIPALVNASAVGYYGNSGPHPVDESAPPGDGFLAGLCARWEAATAPAADAGARVVRLRTGIVLSGRGGALGLMRPVFRFGLGGRFGDGRQYLPWVSATDALAAIRFLLTADVHGPVNITGPVPVTNREFTASVGAALHRPAPWVLPAPVLRLTAGDLAEEMLLSGQRAVPRVLREAGYRFRHHTVAAALHAAIGE